MTLLTIVAALAVAVGGLPGAHATDEPVLEGEHVVHYGLAPYELADSHRLLRQG